MVKRKRSSSETKEGDGDCLATIDTSLDHGRVYSHAPGSKRVKLQRTSGAGEWTRHTLNISLSSSERFSAVPTTLSDGIFKGMQVILLRSAPQVNKRCAFLDLPVEVRLLIYEQLFEPDCPAIRLAENKPAGVVCGYFSKYHQSAPEVSWRTSHENRIIPFERVAIFTANRQISKEAMGYFFANKTFAAKTTSRMLPLLTMLGTYTIKFLAKIDVLYGTRPTFRPYFAKLADATNLTSVRVDTVNWVGGIGVRCTLVGYGRWGRRGNTSPYPQAFFPMLAANYKGGSIGGAVLQSTGYDRETSAAEGKGEEEEEAHFTRDVKAVATILKLDWSQEFCRCKKMYADRAWCDDAKADMRDYEEDCQEDITRYLETVKEDHKRKRSSGKGRVVELGEGDEVNEDDDEDDDYSYLEAAPAPERRDTGRPKRRVVTDNDKSYLV